ncbi:hypothetical protein F0A17_10770 [Billgrantia pellis]|uniref:Uncharacterized protein n=1 Tax=Billgrantia pellis TaxID=2606936 RepID=A0A7V7FYW3_9GAMM|nr:hypothetical protein [Halomonas pellis]KAA0011792.1 hypothetical protein F0A17_10770 [Halomonas pellis]
MPLILEGFVALRVSGGGKESIRIDADDFTYREGGMRVLGDQCTKHEFLYTYDEDPRFGLTLTATALNGDVEESSLLIDARDDIEVEEEQNTIVATFDHDPDQDDEPLTPVSSN